MAGGAFLPGAAIEWFVRVPADRGVVAFGAGVLISAPSFELMQEA